MTEKFIAAYSGSCTPAHFAGLYLTIVLPDREPYEFYRIDTLSEIAQKTTRNFTRGESQEYPQYDPNTGAVVHVDIGYYNRQPLIGDYLYEPNVAGWLNSLNQSDRLLVATVEVEPDCYDSHIDRDTSFIHQGQTVYLDQFSYQALDFWQLRDLVLGSQSLNHIEKNLLRSFLREEAVARKVISTYGQL